MGKRRSEVISPGTYSTKRDGHFKERRISWLKNEFASFSSPETQTHIVEIGTGTGNLLSAIANQYSTWRFWGIDISKLYLQFAARDHQAMDNCSFLAADVEIALPFRQVDAIVSFDVLHHFNNLEAGIQVVANSLVPGGLWLVVEPNLYNPYICCFQALTSGETNFLPWIAEPSFRKHFSTLKKSYFYLIPSTITHPSPPLLYLEKTLERVPFLAGSVGYVLQKHDPANKE